MKLFGLSMLAGTALGYKTIQTKFVGVDANTPAAAKHDDKTQFVKFMKDHNKAYATEETAARFETFAQNLRKIEDWNGRGESWTMGVNEFADLTSEEFGALFKGYKPRDNEYMRNQNLHVTPTDFKADSSVDWRTKGAVTPVKNQGQCGSCWAFSTTGSIEGANQIASGKLVSVSEQQLVDCAGSQGNKGCNGGLMDNGFEYIIKNGGLATEDAYAYTGKDGSCQKADSSVTIKGYTDVKKSDEAGLLSAVNLGPVSIAVDAGFNWQLYHGGVMKGCKKKQLDHGVLAVGYGTDGGDDYWIVKNSWGATWGESGYIRLLRGMDACGLADSASYPTL